MRARLLALSVVFVSVAIGGAQDIMLLPGAIRLTDPKASQRVIALARSEKSDRQVEPKLTIGNPKVARLEGDMVIPVGDGETTLHADFAGKKATAKIRVEKFGTEHAWSFRNHIIPVLTRLGCNSGACHGALAGKGGFKLSLRGYAPEDDHFALTRQALSRRVNAQEPARSLMLLKPTFAQPHGGGLVGRRFQGIFFIGGLDRGRRTGPRGERHPHRACGSVSNACNHEAEG